MLIRPIGYGCWITTVLLKKTLCGDWCPQDDCGYEISCFWYKGIYLIGGTECDVSTGMNEKQNGGDQSNIFPNPAQSQITLDFNLTETSNSAIEIKNILGQTVKTINNSAFSKGKNKIEIDVSEFSTAGLRPLG